MWSSKLPRAVVAGAVATAASALIIGVPTDVIDTALFTRMTPVRGWEYPVLVLTALLTGLWFGLGSVVAPRSGSATGVVGSSVLSTFAVGCPICNKIVVGLLGVSGALGIWAPVQPILGAASVAALGAAVLLRWRRQRCAAQVCAVDDMAVTPSSRGDSGPEPAAPTGAARTIGDGVRGMVPGAAPKR